jgi:hypothetical protein
MNDETWQRELAEAAREEMEADRADLDERWIRLSAGQLSAREEEELRALAETSPEARTAYEAFRPLGPEFKARTMQTLRQRIAPAAPVRASPKAPRPRTFTLPWRTPRFAGWAAAAGAMAAALAIWTSPLGTPSVGSWVATTELSGGDVPERSTTPAPSTSPALYHPGSGFFVVLAPKDPGERCEPDLAAECYLAGRTELRPWQGCAERAKFDRCGRKGRIEGTIGDSLPLEPGEWRLWTVVGRKGKLPAKEKLLQDLLGDPASSCNQGSGVGGRNWSATCIQLLRMEGSP